MKENTRILIIAPSWLGDIIMSQSLLKVLKQQDSNCIIDVYAPEWTTPILKRIPEIDNIIVNPFAHGSFLLKERYREGKKLQNNHYNKAFILPNSWKSALIPFFANIKERIGFKGEMRYFLLNKLRNDKNNFPRMVERYVALAYDQNKVKNAQDLGEFAYPSLITKELSSDFITKNNLDFSRPCLCLGCGANYGPTKLWPPEYFAKVCDYWINHGGNVIALGSKKDSVTVAKIKSHLNISDKYFTDLSGKTNLIEALDVVGMCKAGVCNDSGLMHILAAADTPQVCIFGSTSTKYTPPLSKKAICVESTVSCHPCFKKTCAKGTYECLYSIKPETVLEKLNLLLEKK